MTTRRDFLTTSAFAGGALLGSAPLSRALEAAAFRAPAKLKLLVLGGTGFIGPHLVKYAVSRGHEVTIFTRGRRKPELPASVIWLEGDRNGKLQVLEGKKWDCVVDDSGNVADWVRQSTELLKDSVGRYLFTSSTGVYYPYRTRGVDETTPVHYDLKDPKDGSESFGVMKAQGERFVSETFRGRGLVVRPTYIVGPGDTSDRFPYWPVRLARGGEVLAPGRRDDPVQLVDVRDLAEFMIRLLEESLSVKNARAVKAGLNFRPLADTVRDTLAWWPTVPEARRNAPRFTISAETEQKALAAWHARKGGAI